MGVETLRSVDMVERSGEGGTRRGEILNKSDAEEITSDPEGVAMMILLSSEMTPTQAIFHDMARSSCTV